MPVIARDAVASDHLVYAWPLPIGPDEYEVACAEDELVVMCPAWLVGDRLGPGRHRWRTPDPSRPVSAYFVLTAPVDVSFDMSTQFLIPTNGQAVRIRATGALQVRCLDPQLLVAQFVGLPFDNVNEGVLRSVTRSIERMFARLLTRRVVMAGTPQAVTDPGMLPNIIEELIAYNPTAGAVFGVELMRIGHVSIVTDDGSRPWQHVDLSNGERSRAQQDTNRVATVPPVMPPDLTETARGNRPAKTPQSQPALAPPPDSRPHAALPPQPPERRSGPIATEVSGEIVAKARAQTAPPTEVSGEFMSRGATATPLPSLAPAPPSRPEKRTSLGHVAVPAIPPIPSPFSSSDSKRNETPPAPTQPTPVPGAIDPSRPLNPPGAPFEAAQGTPTSQPMQEARGSIMGIGVSAIGASNHAAPHVASGEIAKKIGPGGRVLVPGPNGLMQSATVRQLLQGYYELEVGGSGETIWVPVNGVVPE